MSSIEKDQNLEKSFSTNSDLKKILEENLELNKKIYESCQTTLKYIHFVKAFNIFKFLIIFIPVIIGILYLIPVIGDFIGMYQNFFNSAGEATGILDGLKNLEDVQQLTP